MINLRVLFLVMLVGPLYFGHIKVADAQTYSAAMAQCTNYFTNPTLKDGFIKGMNSDNYYVFKGCVDYDSTTVRGNYCQKSGAQNCYSLKYYFTGPYCKQGNASVQTQHDNATGESCDDMCEVSLQINIGGGSSGPSYRQTGQMCPSGVGGAPLVSTVTHNADGGDTICTGSKCVTLHPGPDSAPASTDTTGNHSTDSTTTTAPSSSDTTTTSNSTTTGTSTGTTDTTTTGSGDGSGGGGGSGDSTSTSTTTVNNTSTTTGSSIAHTTEPAHSSSTKCTGGSCDVGEADGQIGTLYQSSGVSADSVYGNFRSQVANAPIMSAVSNFFTVTSSGECPSWHIPGNKYWGEAGFDFDFFCSSAMQALFLAMGYMVLAVGAFSALRIAIY